MDSTQIIVDQTPQNFRRSYVRDSVTMTDEQFHEQFQDTVAQVKQVMAIVNAAAFNAMVNAIDEVKKTKLYRGKVKKYLNMAAEAYRKFEYNLKYGSFEGVEFFAPAENIKKKCTREDVWNWYLDIGAFSYKRNARQAEMLRMQLYNEFTRIEAPNKYALSYVCLAHMLLTYSVEAFGQLMKDFRRRDHLEYSSVFKAFKMDAVNKLYEIAAKEIAKVSGIKKEDDVSNYAAENITKAFECYETAIFVDLHSAKSADEAIEANKHLMYKSNYRRYRAQYNKAYMERNGTLPVYEED